ncbi:hypothetical protein BU16DRAFT_551790 [Lophium mytilinum]|uniref:Uncharacterized protein n=1 Tax=Lophium mytilinum TaxID=390894 RepID=A0A6A6QM96_9PEZI|nr:hypothetical protein BU16DRAFT_551790 [Lophium mytilinum]
MENNDRRQRQNTAPGYAGQQGLYNPAAHTSRTGSLTGQSPTSAPSSGNARSAYAYPAYGDSSAQFVGIQPAYTGDYPSSEQQQHARPSGQYPQYGQGLMYNTGAAGAATPASPYDASVAPYAGQPRHQSAAIEVLSSQFGVPQQYYNVAGDAAAATHSAGAGGPTSAPGLVHNVTSYSQMGYTTQQSPREQQLQQPSYAGGMTDPSQGASSASFGYAPAGGSTQGSEFDTAYNQYQTELKRTFQHVRDGRLGEAATLLMNISNWLLGNAEALGLVRDDEAMHTERLKLWDEFNTCWLTTLQQQKNMLETGQRPQPPQSIIEYDSLEEMGKQLVHLCDNMEKHGLVDYQMGVWEEEIINMLTTCLDMLENMSGSAGPTQRTLSASARRR